MSNSTVFYFCFGHYLFLLGFVCARLYFIYLFICLATTYVFTDMFHALSMDYYLIYIYIYMSLYTKVQRNLWWGLLSRILSRGRFGSK